MTVPPPPTVPTGTVTHRYLGVSADGPDTDTAPDLIHLRAVTGVITPSTPRLIHTSGSTATTLECLPIKISYDASGNLQHTDPETGELQSGPLLLPANDDSIAPTITYEVEWSIPNLSRTWGGYFTLEAGETVDLSTVGLASAVPGSSALFVDLLAAAADLRSAIEGAGSEAVDAADRAAGYVDQAREIVDGADAVTVTSGAVSGDDLILTRTDGTTFNAGHVRGARGLPGVNAVPADDAVAGYLSATDSATHAAAAGIRGDDIPGAVGDGVADDSPALQAAIDAAHGQQVRIPAGRYSVSNIQLPAHTSLLLDPQAVLVHRSGGALPMLDIGPATESLTIRGGTIDGQRDTIAGWPVIIRGELPAGKRIDIEGVHFTRTVFAAIRLTNFGGYLNFSRNRITDQAQHSGQAGQFSTVVTIVNGQPGARGTIITDGNWHHFDAPLDHEGSNPGGYFICTSPDVGGGATPDGNLSIWQAIGNYFRGYGQFGGPGTGTNDISPLHTYPTIKGARWANNYFEACGFPAMSAKSVEDFVCTGNTIVDGMRSSRNHASEGAISYVPGYQAGSLTRPRAVISSNVISNPGGEPVLEQTGIAVKGTSTSKATDVLVTNNVYKGGGVGVDLANVENAVLSSNILRCVTGTSPAGAGIGVRFSNVLGKVLVTGNAIECENGNGIVGITGNASAEVILSANEIVDTRLNSGATILFRDCATLKISGNTLRASGGQALNIAGTIGRFAYDEGNSIEDGSVAINWTQITEASGQLVGAGSPVGKVTPAHAGVTYRQTDASGSTTLWLATGDTSSDWSVIQTGSSGSVELVTTPSIVYGTNSAGGPVYRRAVGGERVAGQLPVYGTLGDIVVANTPQTAVSAASKSYVDQAVSSGGGAIGGAPQVSRLLGWTYDPVIATSSLDLPAAGVLATARVRIAAGGALRRIWWQTSAAGAGLADCYAAIYDADGQLLQAVDITSQLGTAGNKSVAFSGPTQVAPGDLVTLALLWNGTSAPKIRGAAGVGITTTGGPSRWETGGSALTAPPETLPPLTATTVPHWLGVGEI